MYKSPGELVYLAADAADAMAYCRSNLGAAADPNPVAVPRTAAPTATPGAAAAAAVTYWRGVSDGFVGCGALLLAGFAYSRMKR